MRHPPAGDRRQVWGQSGVLSHSAAGDSLPTRVPPCDVAFQVLQVPGAYPTRHGIARADAAQCRRGAIDQDCCGSAVRDGNIGLTAVAHSERALRWCAGVVRVEALDAAARVGRALLLGVGRRWAGRSA